MGSNLRLLKLLVALNCVVLLIGNVHSYNRPPPRKNVEVNPSQDDDDDASPQQVHISMAGEDNVRITWITKSSECEAKVEYGLSPGSNEFSAIGSTSSYKYLLYSSGAIHQVVIGPLKPSTVYYYRCGSPAPGQREFNLKTPPSGFPVKFAVVGDLGQTGWTKSTLQHISESGYDMLILPGDLSYADLYQPAWDNFGRLVEPLASCRPWMVTHGNHEVETIPLFHKRPFTAFNARWPTSHGESGSPSNLFYSFDTTGVHVIMLGSYADFAPGSDQYKWLTADLGQVDRVKTPWTMAVVHAPWYNSNTAHRGEKESVEMKKAMEELLYKARVDVVFAGHVHAYERFTRVYNDKADKCGPVHITIGDGGNREGLASTYLNPKPEISIFREASFGHGQLEVVNASHARWTWHRNQDDVAVTPDSVWLTSLSSDPSCKL